MTNNELKGRYEVLSDSWSLDKIGASLTPTDTIFTGHFSGDKKLSMELIVPLTTEIEKNVE